MHLTKGMQYILRGIGISHMIDQTVDRCGAFESQPGLCKRLLAADSGIKIRGNAAVTGVRTGKNSMNDEESRKK